jgi:hypothetical protein
MRRMTAVVPQRGAASQPNQKPSTAKPNPYPWFSPRFWHGMRPGSWWKLCWQHRFRIHPLRWPMAVLVSLINPWNAILGAAQRVGYGRQIDQTQFTQPPVFIIGHWRSGTTYLHELMHLDERFVSPTTYQCFAPHHFLLTQWWMHTLGGWLMPKQRPMDNMAAGWERPQEDEFALLTLGAPTPYLRMAFPNDPPPHSEFFDMQGVTPEDQARFERAMVQFVKLLTFAAPGKRVLLKSPPHTGRVEVLTKLFPGTKFIHITRNPYSLFSSTMRLWRSLDEVQGLQLPRSERMEEYVFDCLIRMDRGLAGQRQRLAPGAIYDLRYEDLVADPVGQVGRIYEALGLGDYGLVRERIAAFADEQKEYKVNRHELDEDLKARIRQRWAAYFERYGYT